MSRRRSRIRKGELAFCCVPPCFLLPYPLPRSPHHVLRFSSRPRECHPREPARRAPSVPRARLSPSIEIRASRSARGALLAVSVSTRITSALIQSILYGSSPAGMRTAMFVYPRRAVVIASHVSLLAIGTPFAYCILAYWLIISHVMLLPCSESYLLIPARQQCLRSLHPSISFFYTLLSLCFGRFIHLITSLEAYLFDLYFRPRLWHASSSA